MNVIKMNVSELIPYENNPRHNDVAVDYIANSIKEFGFKQPIVVDKNNVIIAGHTRLKAAQKLGLSEVPVIIADDLTDDQVKAYRLADNKTAEIATWDFDLLDLELDNIEMDMSDFGFEEIEEVEDKGISLSDDCVYQIVIDCSNEEDAEAKFNIVKEMGLECRISTL